MGVVGTLLKNRRAGETRLAWNLPGLRGPETLELTSEAFGDGQAIPAEHAGKRAGGRNVSPPLAWTAPPRGTAELLLLVEDVDVPMRSPFVHGVARIAADVRARRPTRRRACGCCDRAWGAATWGLSRSRDTARTGTCSSCSRWRRRRSPTGIPRPSAPGRGPCSPLSPGRCWRAAG
jgi:phosphatidylethanolamine-binding protein (PEBP) family uncharacterized protein